MFFVVGMPGMDGIEFAKTLRIRLPDLPMVLPSEYSHVLAKEERHTFELLHEPCSAAQVGRVRQLIIGAPPVIVGGPGSSP